MSKFSIAIDGPSASGKSTMAKILATRLGFTYIDTGAMYRAYTLAVLERGLDPQSEEECDTLIGKISIDFDENNHITLDGKDVSDRVRDNDVADNVSYVSTYKNVRLWLVEIQRKLADDRSVIMDGRDIGTYVLPNASVKFFQIADVNERAERRYMENLGKGIQTTKEECLDNLKKRDYIDSHREFAPLKQASDSILIDTTNMKISDVIDKMLNILKEKGIFRMALGLLAIVGSPSVGKSTIFNRIIGEKKSIIEEERGVTRDRIYAKATWLTRDFMCVDTGGIELENRPFQEQIRIQAQMAIDEADVILFVVDGKVGLTDDDKLVASMLYKSKKPVILAVNKIDSIEHINNTYEFYALGLGDPIATSGVHGIGIGDILDEVVKKLPKEESQVIEESIRFALIGRPNVGKSSLTNAMLNETRTIVSSISGTTRDAIDTPFVRNGRNYVAIDTAGLKKRGKIYESIDKYAAIRALRAIDNSDIAILVIDAEKGIIDQDKHVVGYAIESHKAIIIVVNKWDLIKNPNEEQKEFVDKIRKEFKFLDYAPIIFTSALNKMNINKIFDAIDRVYESYNFEIKTAVLNEIIQEAQMMNETPDFNGGRVKIYYAQQVGTKPLTIALFVNDPKWMHFSYLRYLENKIRDSFELEGSPINLVLRKRK